MNDKKKITIIGVTGVAMLIAAIATPLMLKGNAGFRLRAEPQSHTLYITSVDSYTPGSFDEGGGTYNYSFSGTFEASDGETYSVSSYDQETNMTCSTPESISFNSDGCLFVIDSVDYNNYGSLAVMIHKDYAYLDLEQSHVGYYVNTTAKYYYEPFMYYYEDGDFDIYYCYLYGESMANDGDKLMVKQVKLVFTCYAG